jgi:hypothetical protein
MKRYTPADLADFEQVMGVELPAAYKKYLCEVGAGEHDGRSGISLLEEWTTFAYDFLSQEFPHTEAWNDLSLKNGRAGATPLYYDDGLYRGAIRMANTGEAYHLLVLTGAERGNVWSDERVPESRGIYPLVGADGGRMTIEEYLARR